MKTIKPKIIKTELDDLQYADDTTLFNDSKKQAITNLQDYKKTSEPYEIIINWIKTNIVTNKDSEYILEGVFSSIQIKQKAKLLGLIMRNDGRACDAVSDRISKALTAFNMLKRFFKNTIIETKIRLRILEATIKPILIYALHTQELEKTHLNKLQQKYSYFFADHTRGRRKKRSKKRRQWRHYN